MQKRLYRSRKDSMIGGVCAGIADYLNVDPTIVRIITVILAFSAGFGVVPYFALWLIIPEEPEELGDVLRDRRRRHDDYEDAIEDIRRRNDTY